MTNLTLLTVAAFAALAIAAGGILATVPDTGPVTVLVNGLGGLELVPASQPVVAANPERTY